MAPLPENNVPTYFVDYSFQGQGHTLQARLSSDAALTQAATRVGDFLSSLVTLMDSDWAIEGARFRAQSSDITVPATAPVLAAAPSGGTMQARDFPKFHSFVGRGAVSGRRVRVYVYGLNVVVDGDYRLNGPLTGAFANARTALITAGANGVFRTISGDVPIWLDYVNQGFNSYWERERRG